MQMQQEYIREWKTYFKRHLLERPGQPTSSTADLVQLAPGPYGDIAHLQSQFVANVCEIHIGLHLSIKLNAGHKCTSTEPSYGNVHPSFPVSDGLNNTYVRILHTNSIHHMAMVTCQCQGENSVLMDLVACQLLPASFKKIWTLFSVQLMDHFRLCNLELKATAYQFYQLICRMTTPIDQTKIVNVYHEFCHISQLWRWLKKLRWAGYGHKAEDPHNPPAGSLSLYCPTCPQPVQGRYLANTIYLMAEFQKAPCDNTFRAITNALLLTKACDYTGKVVFACAWHGCFAPNSLANLFKGEQQKKH
ncbi:LOW QUALITY PROTEIN: hypothetical protein CVT25_005288 [Psilocybe cyanescens]|uniref:CxC2-like cysteine cluster KDZ transposase-associated domain-containing protein n=1 Tax=Psilocybe cyanescens TaxID=93625 RepID=A0A409XC45_PSICY|nr:LOW QUALITY PROTEIN: hypothetical protein CVT25_005288 [Psilocybe cyanescens]